MSFSNAVKAELAHIWPGHNCCRRAELAGLILAGGRFTDAAETPVLYLTTAQPAVARIVYRLLKACGGTPRVRSGGHFYHINLPLTAANRRLLSSWYSGYNLHAEISLHRLRRAGITSSCCQRSFLRGVFLAAGSVNGPRSDYHLEMVLLSPEAGSCVKRLVSPFGVTPRMVYRRGNWVLYIKEAEQIGQFLNVIQAHASLLEFESARVFKEVKSRVNRLVNCDTANLNRTVEASMRQTASITALKEHMDLRDLPSGLREVAELRLNYPDVSLRELGQMLSPRVGKATVNYRLNRLEELARSLVRPKAEE